MRPADFDAPALQNHPRSISFSPEELQAMRGVRIGIIVTPYVSEEVWKDEVIYLEDKPWFQREVVRKEDITEHEGKWATPDDRAAYYYIKHVYGKYVDVVMIDPHEPGAYAKAKSTDINFLMIFDLLEAFHSEPTKVSEKMKRLFDLPNVYPGKDYQRFINHKNLYYSYLQSKGIPLIPFVHVSKKEYEENAEAALQKVWGLVAANDFNSIIGKPIYGQEGIDFRIFYAPIKKQRIEAYMNRLFRLYKGIIFQPYIKDFTKESEVKTVHIGEHRYSINVGQRRMIDLDRKKNAELRELNERVMAALPPVSVDGIELSRFITRVDIGVTKDHMFLSEVEFVPSLFSDVYDHSELPLEKLVGDQIIAVAAEFIRKRNQRAAKTAAKGGAPMTLRPAQLLQPLPLAFLLVFLVLGAFVLSYGASSARRVVRRR